jgi:hypothetical protein
LCAKKIPRMLVDENKTNKVGSNTLFYSLLLLMYRILTPLQILIEGFFNPYQKGEMR